MNDLNIYECEAIVRQIEALAEQNEGEITDEQIEALVRAQTTSMVKLGNLCKFIRHVEGRIAFCKEEEERIAKARKQAERRLTQVKGYLTPYVHEQRQKLGRPLEVGTFKLSTRKSESVVLEGEDNWAAGCFPDLSTKKTTYTPNKTLIKQHLQEHGSHPGARLETHYSLQLK